MKRDAIEAVRNRIASAPAARLNMRSYFMRGKDALSGEAAGNLLADCHTAACIAGWTVGTLRPEMVVDYRLDDVAQSLLGLDSDAAEALFRPDGWLHGAYFSRSHAVRVLDHLLATGEVDWKSTRRAKKPAGGSAEGVAAQVPHAIREGL